MNKQTVLRASILAALAAASASAHAEVTVSGYLKNESAFTTSNDQFVGEASSTLDTSSNHSNFIKFENSARLFVNGDFEGWSEALESTTWHLDLNFIIDGAAPGDFGGAQSYSQNDWFRELYVDHAVGDVALRVGKQQVVWGTADGIKLLDIINPTDFRELNQNTMEDSRIPVWMVNAEMDVGEVGNVQGIIAQNRSNRIPGLNSGGATGHPFILKGVDSITGPVNGFINVTPALSRVANSFSLGALGGSFDINAVNGVDGTGDAIASGLNTFTNLTVDGLAANTQQVNGDGSIRANGTAGGAGGAVSGGIILNNIAQNAPGGLPAGNANNNETNLVTATYNPNSPDSAFEYMPNATFSTFNGFSGTAATSGVLSRYVKDYPSEYTPNAGFRYKANLDSGLNFSVNYFYHYDANPSVDVRWVDSADGTPIQKLLAPQAAGGPDTNVANALSEQAFTNDATRNAVTIDANGNATNSVTVLLRDPDTGAFYGQIDPTTNAVSANAVANNQAVLEFRETQNRIHSLGGSFDFSVDALSVPLVIRGEALYDKGVKTPVINRKLMGIGDIQGSLKTEEADFFKYVIGVDATVATNMLISTQFIQFRNLDYVNDSRTCTTQSNAQGSTTNSFDCSTYTADQATLHLTNGLNKAEENKEFVSIFLSKPFGSEQQHRWNNILILEDTGGRWNRFDMEYAFTDTVIGSAEWNYYWGDENSTFGQLQASSNIQFGLKWLLD